MKGIRISKDIIGVVCGQSMPEFYLLCGQSMPELGPHLNSKTGQSSSSAEM